MGTDFRGVPGVYTGNSITSRNIFTTFSPNSLIRSVPSFKFLDGTYSRDVGNSPTDLLRAGLMLGKITSSGLYRPSIIGLTTASYTSGGTSLTVSAATATEVARLITVAGGNVSLKAIGPPTAAGTTAVTSVTVSAASGTTLTVTSLGVDKVVGTALTPADGSQTPITVLYPDGGFPVDVLDTGGTAINQPLVQFLVSGDLIATQIINLTEGDASTQATFKGYLKAAGNFTFDNDR